MSGTVWPLLAPSSLFSSVPLSCSGVTAASTKKCFFLHLTPLTLFSTEQREWSCEKRSQITSFLPAEVPCDFSSHSVGKQTCFKQTCFPPAPSLRPLLPELQLLRLPCFSSGLLQGGSISGPSHLVFFIPQMLFRQISPKLILYLTSLHSKVTVLVWFIPCDSDGKASAYNVGDPGSSPGLGRSFGEGNGNPLQYSCLENPMDGGAW